MLNFCRKYSSSSASRIFIEKVVKDNPVVVFMKGTAQQPMCGFSRTVCQILQHQGLPRFTTVNVLEDEEIRAEIKKYTQWPTIPQVFVRGEFVGGCDILMEMYRNGELSKLLEGLVEEEPKDH